MKMKFPQAFLFFPMTIGIGSRAVIAWPRQAPPPFNGLLRVSNAGNDRHLRKSLFYGCEIRRELILAVVLRPSRRFKILRAYSGRRWTIGRKRIQAEGYFRRRTGLDATLSRHRASISLWNVDFALWRSERRQFYFGKPLFMVLRLKALWLFF